MLVASPAPGTTPIRVDLTYDAPCMQRQKLGGTPQDYFDNVPAPVTSGVTSCANGACAVLPQEVWRDSVVLGTDSKPTMQTLSVHLEDRPHSPLGRGLAWGVPVALGVGLAGALTGGAGVGLMAAVVGGALAGGMAAHSAWGDRVRLEWVEHDIEASRMQGYQERVEPGTLWGKDGYFHRFEPVVETRPLGTWQSPQIVHYKENQ